MLKKQQRVRPVVLTVCLAALAAAAMAGGGHKINHSPLDHVVIFEDSFDKTRPVRMQRFAAEDADLGKSGKRKYADAARRMKETAPEALANGVVDKLTYLGDKIDYRLILGERLEMRVQTDGKQRFERGEKLKAHLPRERCRAVVGD